MPDFTITKYQLLISELINQDYSFIKFQDFYNSNFSEKTKFIILRHDVDLLPENSLEFAKIQNKLGIKASYFFRIVPESFDERIIKEISNLGHEIGYHYEDMDLCKGVSEKAILSFEKNLRRIRNLAEVKTICMHGSPRSSYDNRDLWKNYNYKDHDIIAEPYFDIDFNQIAYYTDTGRMWNGEKFSVRDKVEIAIENSSNKKSFPKFQSTHEIIQSVNSNSFPNQVMFTFHPQRWTNNPALWTKELFFQSAKNIIKKYFFVK